MFEFCYLHYEYAELHTPSSFRFDELLGIGITKKIYETERITGAEMHTEIPILILYKL